MAGKRWTLAELDALRLGLERGQTPYQIARILGRSIYAVHKQMTHKGWWKIAGYRDGLSAGKVGALFHVHHAKIGSWIRKRHLKAQILRLGEARWYLIDLQSVIEFIENTDHWMLWDPERLTDPELREYALELRQNAGWEWLTLPQASRRLQIEHSSMLSRLSRGYYPQARFVGKNWWIPSHVLTPQSELLTPAEIGVLLGYTPRTIRKWCRDGKYQTALYIRRQWYIDRTEVLLKAQQKRVQ